MPPLLVFLFALFAPYPYPCTPTATSAPAPSSILIRRRIPLDPSSRLGSRYSLLNSRLARRRPKKKNLDPEQLHDILGKYFDARWMSAEDPGKEPELVVSAEGGRHRAELGRQLHKLSLGQELGEPVARALEKWLLRKGTCPVKYAWEDTGPLFWPRFVRRGSCSSGAGGGGSCSWPPGMHCVPAGTRALHLLRWQCKQAPPRRGRGRDTAPKCGWVVVPYPVTTDCMCTC